jgi:hypothetical protein
VHLLVSFDPLRLSSFDTFFFSILKIQLVVGVIWIKVWRCGGGVLVLRPLGGPHMASGSFIIF